MGYDLKNTISCDHPDFYLKIIEAKLHLRQEHFRSHYDINRNVTETNFSTLKSIIPIGELNFEYNYQRFDLKIPNFYGLEKIYNIITSGEASTFLTNCGMSAISAFFLALKETVGTSIEIIHQTDIYFESIHLINNYFSFIERRDESSPKTKKIRLLYLDSISSTFKHELGLNGVDLIVFDTTCFEVESEKIKQFISFCESVNAVVVLLRSHVKLDYMGIEIGKMGSLIVFGNQNVSVEYQGLQKNLAGWISDVISRFGFIFELSHLYPLQFDMKYRELNKKRIQQIMNNTQEVFNVLSEKLDDRFTLTAYAHALFVTVGIRKITERDKLKEIKSSLVKKLIDKNLPVREAGSFGFDFIAFDNYKQLNTNCETLRISMSDIDQEGFRIFMDILTKELRTSIEEN